MGRTGQETLITRVKTFNIDNVSAGTNQFVRKMLKDYTVDQARVISAGAATFLVWVR